MGDEITLKKGKPTLDIFVHATAPIARLDIVRQTGLQTPVYVYNAKPNKAKLQFQWTDHDPKAGQVNMYYVRITQTDRRMAWASPIWVKLP